METSENAGAAKQTVETPLVSTAAEEKAPDSSENAPKPKVLKAKKRKKPKDSTAPRVPLTGTDCNICTEEFLLPVFFRLYEVFK